MSEKPRATAPGKSGAAVAEKPGASVPEKPGASVSERLRVVVATPLPPELCAFIERAEPRIELIHDQSLLPPERWPGDFGGDPAFVRTPRQQERFRELIDSADVLYGIPDVRPAELARTVRANPRLRWVQAMAAGAGSTVKAARLTTAELRRVTFTTGAGVHARPLAEFALFGLLAGAKHLPRLLAQQSRREWPGRRPMAQLSEQAVLVVGMGGIGREVARMAGAFGAKVLGVNRSPATVDGVEVIKSPGSLAELAGSADAIVNTLPGTDETRGLISEKVLANLRPGATVVSVGRGTVIDEQALVAALRTGQVGFAALDVFAVEPLPADSPLWTLPNVLISPHTAANSPSEERLLAELFLDNAARHLDGRPLRNVMDTVAFY